MLKMHKELTISYRLYDLQETSMPSAETADRIRVICLTKAGSSGCLGPGAALRKPE